MEVLRYGSSGSDVRNLQNNLNKIGYELTVDGKFGPATSRAVSDFQDEYGLDVDGVAGPDTMAMLARVIHERIGEAVNDCLAAIQALPEFKTLTGLM